MMRVRRTKNDFLPPHPNGGGGGGEKQWELRPGGMLVQKRITADENRVPLPTIRVRIKYGPIHHEIHISPQATFGELKKMLSGPTGLHHQDQKVFYKNKERDSNAFLDRVGVKDKSKMVLEEDPLSQEKRYLELRKNSRMEKAAKSLSQISLEVDRLGVQVSGLESVVSKGGKVVEKDLVNLIELLMNQLLKLDGVVADGEVKLQRKMQVRRVQKYVVLKIKNAMDEPKQRQPKPSPRPASIVVTTQCETFDSITVPDGPPSMSTDSSRPTPPTYTWGKACDLHCLAKLVWYQFSPFFNVFRVLLLVSLISSVIIHICEINGLLLV